MITLMSGQYIEERNTGTEGYLIYKLVGEQLKMRILVTGGARFIDLQVDELIELNYEVQLEEGISGMLQCYMELIKADS